MKKLLTILTPTYNRGEYLENIFVSLQQQTNQNFEWIIVDDGSTDNTEKIVESFIKSDKLVIKYLYKKNGGKHTAVNYGLKYISTVILDSDDYFTNDAVEVIEKTYNENKNEKNICGFTFLKRRRNGELFGSEFPREGRYNFSKWRLSKVVTDERCDVFYSDVMKNYPCSEYEGEKYIGESTMMIKMSSRYDMICKNIAIYIADYLEGGLTDNSRKLRLHSLSGIYWRRRLKSALLYDTYRFLKNIKPKKLINDSNAPLLTTIFYPISIIIGKYWKNKYKL